MKAHIIYHTDADGYCSGAIVYRDLIANGVKPEDIKFHPVKYGDLFPEEARNKDDLIAIVDFSFPMETMEKVVAATSRRNLVWIDHHKTSFDAMMAYPNDAVREIRGRRINSSQPDQRLAGCELTWDYFTNPMDGPMPRIVKVVGEYDTWRYVDELSLEDQVIVLNVQSGCNQLPDGGNINNPEALDTWLLLLSESTDTAFTPAYLKLVLNGAAARERELKRNAKICEAQAFETKFAGYRAIAVNSTIYSSQLFESVYDKTKHDIMVVFAHLKEGYWKISIYSTNPAIDCGALCKKLSEKDPCPPTSSKGGGHVGAGGFQASWALIRHLFMETGGMK